MEVLFGETLPGNALNYIWANQLPEQSMVANAYTDKTMMIAVNSGPSRVGEWVTVTRDLVADYRQPRREPPAIVGVAIMTDATTPASRPRPGMATSPWSKTADRP